MHFVITSVCVAFEADAPAHARFSAHPRTHIPCLCGNILCAGSIFQPAVERCSRSSRKEWKDASYGPPSPLPGYVKVTADASDERQEVTITVEDGVAPICFRIALQAEESLVGWP